MLIQSGLMFNMKSCLSTVNHVVLWGMRLECPNPAPRNAIGKLPYDVALRAPDERKRKPQSFTDKERAHEDGEKVNPAPRNPESRGSSKGSGRSSTSRYNSKGRRSPECRSTNTDKERAHEDGEKVNSPMKSHQETDQGNPSKGVSPRQLFQEKQQQHKMVPRKRKSNPKGEATHVYRPTTPANTVPHGLVSSRIAQLGSASGQVEKDSEALKKQKLSDNPNALSAAAASGSPRRAQ
ncbi:unnamed protein product [Urochloa humidicola]